MANYDPKKIDIHIYNVAKFIEIFGENSSIQRFCNELLDKYFQQLIIELSAENFNNISTCASQLGKDNSFVVNTVLEKLDLVAVTQPNKIKVEVAPHKADVKVNKKIKLNKVSNW